MSAFDATALSEFYARVSSPGGVSVAHLQAQLEELFGLYRSAEDLSDYRLSRQPWKKLADEITPISRFLRFRNIRLGQVRFPLDNDPPDAWFWPNRKAVPVGIEVTIAQGTERFHLATELVRKGASRGFIGLADDAHPAEFESAMAKSRVMYTSDRALSTIGDGILRCLSRKNKPKFSGYTLLIQAPLMSLPRERWNKIKPKLRAAAANLPFSEVHVISNADGAPWGFQIKG
jgi:hypothetical protein